jgi:hypothetical protein
MHRFLFFVCFAAACGGTRTIQATQQIKDGAAQAQQGLQGASTNGRSVMGMEALAEVLATAGLNQNGSGLDLSALPDAATLAAKGTAPRGKPAGGLAPPRPAADTSQVSGCIEPDASSGQPAFIAAGQSGCAASDHLEIDYSNGDQANVIYLPGNNSFEMKISVAKGAWAGTSLDYAASAGNVGVSIHATGAVKFAPAAAAIDSLFDITWVVQLTVVGSVENTSVQLNGAAIDHLVSTRTTFGWDTTLQVTAGQTTGYAVDWTGSLEVDLLKSDGSVQDSAKWNGVHLHADVQTGGTALAVSYSASGDLLWDGARVGSVATADAQHVVVHFTDGSDAPFDPLTLFGPAHS